MQPVGMRTALVLLALALARPAAGYTESGATASLAGSSSFEDANSGSGWVDGSASWDLPASITGLMKSGYSHCSMTRTQAKVFKSTLFVTLYTTGKCPRALTFESMRQGWDDIVQDPDFKNRYRTGGLGIRSVPGQCEVWICDRYDTCHGGKVEDDMMCYAFNEEKSFFLPLGPNSKVKFVKSKTMSAPFLSGGGGSHYIDGMNGSVGGMNGSEGSQQAQAAAQPVYAAASLSPLL